MTGKTPWFTVDRAGLAKIVAQRGKGPLIAELIQNAWDEAVKLVNVQVPMPVRGYSIIRVEDDSPDGWQNLSHAYTLFAESAKKANPLQRGRFNLGEKLVLAMCRDAQIQTTTGTIIFDRDGRHQRGTKRVGGSEFSASIHMTKAEWFEAVAYLRTLIPPPNVTTTINGTPLLARTAAYHFESTLPTITVNGDGELTRTRRACDVTLYVPEEGETASIYEMGLPVVETADKYHVDIGQKVPLNADRDNVPPAFLREVRVAVLNETCDMISKNEATDDWVQEASGDKRCSPEATGKVLLRKYGQKRVAYDVSDPEANKIAASKGYTVVQGGSMSRGQWANAKDAAAIKPAGQVTPSAEKISFNPAGKDITVPVDDYTPGMARVVQFVKAIAPLVLNRPCSATIVRDPRPYAACYGTGYITLNLRAIKAPWFDNGISTSVIDLVIHEFGHEYSDDHCSAKYHEALTVIGARMVRVAIDRPELFA